MIKKERESSFELLRIVAQILIVYYHILLFAVYPLSNESIYKAIWIPLHIGVPLFILISGYFRIKTSVRGAVKYLGMAFVLQLPFIISELRVGDGLSTFSSFFFISRTPFWFVRTYFFLYLMAPVINLFLDRIDLKSRIALWLALFFISDYVGNIGLDDSLKEGYNIFTFLLYYVTGDTICKYKHLWEKIPAWVFLTSFIIVNSILVAVYTVIGLDNNWVLTSFVWLFFGYCSPYILVNAAIFFMMFGKMNFQSKFINNVAKASFAIYILHGTFLSNVINPVAESLYGISNHIPIVLLFEFGLTLVVVASCVIIYWLLTPVWKVVDWSGKRAQSLYDTCVDKVLMNKE